MCSRSLRPLGLPIYVARVPAAPFSPLPTAALPSMSLSPKRSIPDRDVFYVARPDRSIFPSAFLISKSVLVWLFPALRLSLRWRAIASTLHLQMVLSGHLLLMMLSGHLLLMMLSGHLLLMMLSIHLLLMAHCM